MNRTETKPFLITRQQDGSYRLTLRDTHYNSQGYPIVKSFLQDEVFATAAAAKAHARTNFNARAGEYAMA